MSPERLKALLEGEAAKRDDPEELSRERPDPLWVARRHWDASVALVCALFGYGSAVQIVRFLESLDFDLLHAEESAIRSGCRERYYRFQKGEDLSALFIALRRLKEEDSLQEIFLSGYRREGSVLWGIDAIIAKLQALYPHESRGYRFLLGSRYTLRSSSPYKRWNMFLRWMVRKDRLDMGLWSGVSKGDLLIPLDTHTFRVSQRLGLLERRQYDLKSVVALTESLKRFDPDDPVKYDFALYRLGQERLLASLK